MCRKMIYFIIVVLMLGLTGNSSAQPTGEILVEWWFDIGAGNAVNDMLNHPRFPDSPTGSAMLDIFEVPQGTKPDVLWSTDVDNYGARIRGYLYPPATGDYTFWITGDNGSMFLLSSNYDSSNSVMMCEVPNTQWTGAREWGKFPDDQQSDPVRLEAGKKYYVEALYKEGSGGDGVAVGWGGPGIGAGPVVITGDYLSPVTGPTVLMATNPYPADDSVYRDTWVSLSWSAGGHAVTHDVYFGDNYDDVDAGTGDTFKGNQPSPFFVVGFPGYPYPDGLTLGKTYYWRVDEVNDLHPDSPWKGNIWSFIVPPKTAIKPVPADGAELVPIRAMLTWTAGFGAKFHYVVFGDDFDKVSNTIMGVPNGTATYNPGTLNLAKTYYWRVDEFDGVETHKGDVWSFTTEGAVSGPNPANGAVGVKSTVILRWEAGAVAASHEVYFGADADAVRNATKSSPEYKGPKALGEESYATGKLSLTTTYYWRIDEVNGVNPNSPWAGSVWSFTTGDFFVVDDFEDYDAGENQIWYSWLDGLGYGTPGTAGYYAGNGTGAAVGDETTASYTEETIVHGGGKSMPFTYDNNKQGYSKYSEVELKLSAIRDWTEEGVAELSLWFRGNPASTGSFVENPAGTYTMTGSGADIWSTADEFHCAFKSLTGVGSIVAKVLSVDNTDPWAKAGVMIRETLEPGSKFAAVYITPGNGCRFQARTDTGVDATSDTSVVTTAQTAITAPYWVKLERDFAGNFRGYYSADGTTWQSMSWNPQNISMSSNVYVGLAVTSHNAALTCQARFSNVTITGSAGAQWMNQDIGIASNDAEPLYVALSNSAGAPAVVYHDDPAAANIDAWTEWIVPLQSFAEQGISLTNVDRIAIGLGTRGNMTNPGGSGKMYIDDIRLCKSRIAP